MTVHVPLPPIQVDVSVAAAAWTDCLPQAEEQIVPWVQAALSGAWDMLDLPPGPLEISVMLADDQIVRCMNRDWRGQDKSTNVLSFAALDDEDAPQPAGAPVLLGDVILALETCRAEAADQKIGIQDHVAHLVVHGVLHLLGFDHEEDEDEAVLMEGLETRILAGLGIADPYAGDDAP